MLVNKNHAIEKQKLSGTIHTFEIEKGRKPRSEIEKKPRFEFGKGRKREIESIRDEIQQNKLKPENKYNETNLKI